MSQQKWSDLQKIAKMAYDRDAKVLSDIKAAELQVVEKQKRLTDLNQQALAAYAKPHPTYQQNGDVMWQAWVGKNERQLNLERARLRAFAEIQKPKLRKSFGRKVVLEELCKARNR